MNNHRENDDVWKTSEELEKVFDIIKWSQLFKILKDTGIKFWGKQVTSQHYVQQKQPKYILGKQDQYINQKYINESHRIDGYLTCTRVIQKIHNIFFSQIYYLRQWNKKLPDVQKLPTWTAESRLVLKQLNVDERYRKSTWHRWGQ